MGNIPGNSKDVTAGWLTDVLRNSGTIKDASVSGFDGKNLGEGYGLMGEVVRLNLEYDQPEDGAPRSVIGKFAAEDVVNLGVAKSMFFYPREVGFYTQLAPYSPVRTAKYYHADLAMPDQDFVLLLEDFDTATRGDQVAGTTPEQTELAMTEIAKLHGAWWGKVDEGPMTELFDFTNPEFLAAVQDGYQAFVEPSLENFADYYSDYTAKVARELGPKTVEFLSNFNGKRRTFVHGDFRADNMMFGDIADSNGFALLDWQISGRGSGLYDIAYLICNSVPREYRKQAEQDLLKNHHATLMEMGVEDYSFDECWEDYRTAVLSGLYVAVYASGGLDLGNERGVELAKAALRRVDAAVNELQVGEFLPK
jgi:hypothetical protein